MKTPARVATPELPRRGQKYTRPELLRAMVLAERATIPEVAAALQRPATGVEAKLSSEGVRASQGRITPGSLARETGYHPRTIAAVARRLGAGRTAASPGSRRRRYMSESEAERVVAWLRENSLRDWSADSKRTRRAGDCQRERHARHESRSNFVVGQPHGDREIVAVEVRGERRPRLMVQLRCRDGHALWVDANEVRRGRGTSCGACLRPKLASRLSGGDAR